MSKVFYRRLSEDARNLLEQDLAQRGLFQGFLGVLEDVLASKSVTPEPPIFTPEERQAMVSELSVSLTFNANVRATAAANSDGVFAVQGEDATKFLSELLSEYDQILRGTGRLAVH